MSDEPNPVWPETDSSGEGLGDAHPAPQVASSDIIVASEIDLEPTPEFDIDDRLSASKAKEFAGGVRITVGFQALIDWASGTKVNIQVVSYTTREGGNPNVVYDLLTDFVIVIWTKKFGKTSPPLDVTPMEDDWPTYGLNPIGASLTWGQYRPGSPFVFRSNTVKLPFSGTHVIRATGEPRDNKTHRVSISAFGGFVSGQRWRTDEKSAIRGGA